MFDRLIHPTNCDMSEHRLNEVVIERPRTGWKTLSLKKLGGYYKELDRITKIATEDGLLSPYLIKPRDKTKRSSDHLSPLRQLLRSKVGQPWNDVYSELCQRLDIKSMTARHVRDHIWDYVELHVEMIEGVPYGKPTWGSWVRLDRTYRTQFYVHPETGILCEVEKVSRQPYKWSLQEQSRRRYGSTDIFTADRFRQYHKLNGIWYLITFELFPSGVSDADDLLLGRLNWLDAVHIYGCQAIYAVSKRQCNKKEIRWILEQLAKD